jgi:ABC-type Fe3+ transport system substrate-binding protein
MGNRYPLDRFLYICTARPMPEVAREFVRLALSSEGQSIVAATAQGYIPLLARDAAAESAGLSLHSGGCPAALTSAGAQRP